jgi:hypothetical protein
MPLGEQIRFLCVSTEHRRSGRDAEGGEPTVNAGDWRPPSIRSSPNS